MAGCPWNLLDDRGMRIAWCGTDNNHEKDGELIANDILNLVAIAEAASELLEKGNAKLAEKDAEIERLTEAFNQSITDAQLPIMATMQAEIERLKALAQSREKALEQACSVVGLRMNENLSYKDTLYWSSCPVDVRWIAVEPPQELAAYLRERDSRPPERGVRSGVQEGDENADTA
jgi:hypothetical protein